MTAIQPALNPAVHHNTSERAPTRAERVEEGPKRFDEVMRSESGDEAERSQEQKTETAPETEESRPSENQAQDEGTQADAEDSEQQGEPH